ncbi:MAG: carbohydrate ABC transporter permease [Candidatus Rokubacteria bacterium]|nr:carbohydrate ABC transporter permease [Candidatus Rokubacteria bacterium]
MRRAGLADRAARLLLLALLLVFSAAPIAWLVLTSFKNRVDVLASPPRFLFTPQVESYGRLLLHQGSTILGNLQNSLAVAMATTAVVVLLSTLAAFSFSRYAFRGRAALFLGLLATRLLPPITTVIPLFLLWNRWKLVDTHLGLILIYSGLNAPLAVWMIKAFLDGVPVELEQAAMIDGCSRLGALRRVTLPLAAPGLAATAVFVFVLAWNEFMFAFIFTSVHAKTMPVIIAQGLGELQVEWTDIATLGTVVMLPTVVLTFLAQKHLVKGLTAGALK